MLVASLLQQVSNSHCRPVLQRVPHLAHINPTQQARASLRQLVRAKAHQHLYQQASVRANQHQAQQMLAKVLQQVQATQHLYQLANQPVHRLVQVVQPQRA